MSQAHWSRASIAQFSNVSPEIEALPPKWSATHLDDPPYRVYFIKPDNGGTTWDHPTLGPLPEPWELRLVDVGCIQYEPRYQNDQTGETISTDPRFHPDVLKARRQLASNSPEMRVAGSVVKNYPGLMAKLYRAPISADRTLRDRYEIVHTIDAGDGTIGAMNAGVHVVRLKGYPQLYVEKRFKSDSHWAMIRREVEMMRRVRHGSLTFFCAAFIDEVNDPKDGSIIVEFCDRGSLEDIIKTYIKRRAEYRSDDLVPELFAWHAFLGLADGFAYLQGGRSYVNDDPHSKWRPEKGWMPILHRDTKPDNILLRSRSTLASTKYFYCILSDFGLACDDDGNDYHQKTGMMIGTGHYLAPELCWDPYYRKDAIPPQKGFPSGARHSSKSDIWALAACIFNLVHPDHVVWSGKTLYEHPAAHITFKNMPKELALGDWMTGRGSRREMVVRTNYSKQLKDGIALAGRKNPALRPDAIECVRRLKIFLEEGKIKATGPQRERDRLPPWATRHHDLHSR